MIRINWLEIITCFLFIFVTAFLMWMLRLTPLDW